MKQIWLIDLKLNGEILDTLTLEWILSTENGYMHIEMQKLKLKQMAQREFMKKVLYIPATRKMLIEKKIDPSKVRADEPVFVEEVFN